MNKLEPGITGEKSVMVEQGNTASHLGSGGVPVFATPMMILAMEEAALGAVDKLLEPGQATVGYHLDVKHLAATPVGMRVTARAELLSVEGKMLTFRVEAFDEKEKIGEGTHVRAIVVLDRFKEKMAKKATLSGAR
jgi:fluoroacetyl-CoA thioesterase